MCFVSAFNRMGVQFTLKFDKDLHDRRVEFDHGWVVKMGRGLDFFQKTPFEKIGKSQQELRRCHKTSFDFIFNSRKDGGGDGELAPLTDVHKRWKMETKDMDRQLRQARNPRDFEAGKKGGGFWEGVFYLFSCL